MSANETGVPDEPDRAMSTNETNVPIDRQAGPRPRARGKAQPRLRSSVTARRVRIAGFALVVALASACIAPEDSADTDDAARRTIFGDPDLQGIWQTMHPAVWNIEDHPAELGVPAGQGIVIGGQIPYRPEALAQREHNRRSRATADPEASCKMVGVPRIMYMPYPIQIVQTPGQVTILSEYVHTVRKIYLDSPRPEEFAQPAWMGDSRGHWDGETLVVDSVNFTDQTWLDRSGNFHSDALHIVERFTRTGPDHLLYEATIEDPQVFTEPWQISLPLYRRIEDNVRLLEYECQAYLEASRNSAL